MTFQNSAERRQWRFATVEKYLASGQTQKQFCQQEHLAYSTFQVWLKKYRQTKSASASERQRGSNFIPLTLPPSTGTVDSAHYLIEYPSGVVLHISGSIAPATLMQLIQASGI